MLAGDKLGRVAPPETWQHCTGRKLIAPHGTSNNHVHEKWPPCASAGAFSGPMHGSVRDATACCTECALGGRRLAVNCRVGSWSSVHHQWERVRIPGQGRVSGSGYQVMPSAPVAAVVRWPRATASPGVRLCAAPPSDRGGWMWEHPKTRLRLIALLPPAAWWYLQPPATQPILVPVTASVVDHFGGILVLHCTLVQPGPHACPRSVPAPGDMTAFMVDCQPSPSFRLQLFFFSVLLLAQLHPTFRPFIP